MSILEQRGKLFKRIISGKPSIVINQNGVDLLELKKNNENLVCYCFDENFITFVFENLSHFVCHFNSISAYFKIEIICEQSVELNA